MADTIRDVVIRLTIQQQDFRAKALDLGELKKSLAEREKLFESSAKKVNDVLNRPHTAGGGVVPTAQFDALNKKVADLEKRLAGLGNKTDDFARKSQTSMLGAADSFKMAGEGAFTLARGVAFLVSDSDESFRDMLQNVARVQGSFDLFKGSVDTVKGLTQGLQQLGGTAGAVQKLGGIVSAAFSPWGLLLGSVAAGLGAVAFAFRNVSNEAEEARRRTDAFIAGRVGQFARNLGSSQRGDLMFARGSELELIARGVEGDPQARLAQLADRESQVRADFARREAEIAAFRRTADNQTRTVFRAAEVGGSYTVRDNETSLRILEQSRLASLENEKALQEQIAGIHSQRMQAQRDHLRLLDEEQARHKGILTTINQQIAAERDRVRGFESSLGRLSTEDFMSLQNIARKVNEGGQINRTEADFLSRSGFSPATGFADQFFQREGQSRGASEIARAFGGGSRVGELEQQAQDVRDSLDNLRSEAQHLREQFRVGAKDLLELVREMIQQDIQGAIDGLKATMEARRQEQRNN